MLFEMLKKNPEHNKDILSVLKLDSLALSLINTSSSYRGTISFISYVLRLTGGSNIH